MMQLDESWQPDASLAMLHQRAALLRQLREFFHARDVLEVDTPIISRFGVTDVHLSNLVCRLGTDTRHWYLQTSPEYAMKRLLAAGSPSIYQLGKVFRDDELSSRHNPEFTMLEWYRLGFTMNDLIAEVDELLQATLKARPARRLSYRQLFLDQLQVDILRSDGFSALQGRLQEFSAVAELAARERDFDTLQQLAMALIIEPRLDPTIPVIVYDYPVSQAALAQVSVDDPRVAYRFEVFYQGMELANGYQELTDARVQLQRFELDQQHRQRAGLPPMAIDTRLMAALEAGLPPCAGIALGFDRLLMIQSGATHIREVLPFSIARA
ncbi:EF-P lysine aminoacylase EpmA [Pseudidiomarina sp.]|uniref:EF-P lysine aminoacylase EpmA n=1 Tax=Pseudidiomarina sp. TaxID=2081707 RepID=UPI00299F1055|nr:EF-P lysine aminoacylase EpmA [Pseudidiomarina sp.]MDX1706395.1 EF-P lysine aminoacylase EpmA [Pseudidiomarina sp.]